MDNFEALKKYKELFDLGIITEEEFKEKKDELLNGLMQKDSDTDTASEHVAQKPADIDQVLSSEQHETSSDSSKMQAITASVSDKISTDSINKAKEKFKELPPKKRTLIAVVAIAVVVLIVFACTTTLGNNNDYSSNSTSTNQDTSSISDDTIKMLVSDALYDEVGDCYYSVDPSSCKYSINKTERDGDKTYVYGEVTLYDKYGKLASDHPFKTFEVELDGYAVKRCEIMS